MTRYQQKANRREALERRRRGVEALELFVSSTEPTAEQLAVYMAGTKGLQWDSLTLEQQDRWREMAQMRMGLDADI